MTIKPTRTLVSFDWAMKSILRDKANFDVLEGFLTTLLNRELKVVSLLESETNAQSDQDKFNRVDLLVQDEQGEIIFIEIQHNRDAHYLKHLLYGASKLVVENLQLARNPPPGPRRNRQLMSARTLYPEYYLIEVERLTTDDHTQNGGRTPARRVHIKLGVDPLCASP